MFFRTRPSLLRGFITIDLYEFTSDVENSTSDVFPKQAHHLPVPATVKICANLRRKLNSIENTTRLNTHSEISSNSSVSGIRTLCFFFQRENKRKYVFFRVYESDYVISENTTTRTIPTLERCRLRMARRFADYYPLKGTRNKLGIKLTLPLVFGYLPRCVDVAATACAFVNDASRRADVIKSETN